MSTAWIPLWRGLPPMTDEGWCEQSAEVLVRYESARSGRVNWCAGYLRRFREDGEPEVLRWYVVGPDGYEIEGTVNAYAEVTL